MNSRRAVAINVPAGIVLCLLITVGLRAQVQTNTTSTSGQATTQTTVERGEVVSVSGNDLVVRMEDGSLRHFANVPESARVTVDGKELGIHDLKPGMKLQRTIATTTTPKTITTVQTVTGTVWQVMPPKSVILRLEDNSTQQFTIPKGQKFTVNGQETDAFGLRKGMKISATKIVEVPQTVVEEQRKVTGTMPPPPPPPAPDQPMLVAVVAVPVHAPVAAATEPKTLPKTGSPIPLLGILGLLSLATAFGLRGTHFNRKS